MESIYTMRLPHAILTALVVGILSSLILAIYIASQLPETGAGWYGFIMIFGNTIIPILLTTCLFALLKKKNGATTRPVRYVAQVGLVLLIMAIGIFLMTISLSLSYFDWPSGLLPENLKSRFDRSYKGYVPDVLLISLLIPIIYDWVSNFKKMK